ncbi:MAG: hypothetical protein V3V14_10510, partial [Saprospiraceae bacterium]
MIKKIFFGLVNILILVLFIATPNLVNAKHIVGGDVTYECKGINGNKVKFEITFTMYRDSKGNGAAFDAAARFGIFKGHGNNWTYVGVKEQAPLDINAVNIDTGNPCLVVPSGIGVEKGVYRFEVELEVSETESYMIAYQRCCRNNTIFNIVDPDVTGAVFSVTISPIAQSVCDDSPIWNGFPPVVICANTVLNFDHSATDSNGDQIVYSFCNPIAAGGIDGVNFGNAESCTGITPKPIDCGPPFDLVQFKLPDYRVDIPLGNGVAMNQSSGLISGIPTVVGQFVVGVCAQTFRNGVLIGSISRDFQFNVTPCEISVRADIASNKVINDPSNPELNSKFIINSCGDYSVDVINLSTDESKIFSYLWELEV